MSFQRCPVCNGTGQNQAIAISNQIPPCSVCKGAKIINEQTGRPPEQMEANQPYFNIIENKSLGESDWYYIDMSGNKIPIKMRVDK